MTSNTYLRIFLCGLMGLIFIVILVACSKSTDSTNDSNLIPKTTNTTSENPIEEEKKEPTGEDIATSKVENGAMQITQGLLEDTSEEEVNKGENEEVSKEINKEAPIIENNTEVATNDEDNTTDSEKKVPGSNKGIANSSSEKPNQSDIEESIEEKTDEKTDDDGQKQAKITEMPEISIKEENAIQITVEVPEYKTVEAYDPTLYPGWVLVSQDNPLSIETTLSINSEKAKADDIQDYTEETFPVFQYTYDCVDGCWKFTKSAQRNFYFYIMNDDYTQSNDKETPKMIRSYLSDGTFVKEYLNTDDWFYAPYEDDKGNIYAECGRYIAGGHKENPSISIYQMNSGGKTLRKVDVADILDKDTQYKGFSMIKKNIIAVLTEQTLDDGVESQLKIIDISKKEILAVIHLNDQVMMNIKSDGDYFALISSSYQSVYVFDANTYQIMNTIDTTKCKELCVYEWKVNDWENGKYANLSYELDIKDGTIYFLRHSGIYKVDCLGTEFTKVMDGSGYVSFNNQLNKFLSFFVGENDDFYILGVYVDEESATTMWHYTKTQ